ncbi:MAG: PstS family phosphate ABC transporter substrate-binding protein [Candidatus Deferrimicrobiaceae bacterium]
MTGSRVVAIMTVLAFLSPAVFAEETIRVSGTGAAIGGMKLLGEAFGKKHPGVKVDVISSLGSTGGIKAVAAGKLDLAVSVRRVKEEEKVPGLVEKPYAKSPFIFATSSSNPINGLSLSEIRDIYAGKKTTWPDGRMIFLVLRPAHDAFTGFLENLSPEMKDAVASSKKRPGMFIGITDQEAADQIERIPGSFGMTSYSLVASEKRNIKPLAVDGIPPVGKDGINEKYPYFMTLSLVYVKDRTAAAIGNFIHFIASKEGETILRMNGQIPIGKAQSQP